MDYLLHIIEERFPIPAFVTQLLESVDFFFARARDIREVHLRKTV